MQVDYRQFADPHGNKWWIIAGVMVFQSLAILAIQSGMGQRFLKIEHKPIEAELIQEQKPKIEPPKPPPFDKPQPKTVAKPDYVPPVEVPRVETPNNSIAQFSSTPQAPSAKIAEAAPVQPQVQAPVRTPAVINASSSCETPEYPSQSRRLQESGTVQMRFYVGSDGRVIESSVEKSSGYRRLDEAARLALSKCQFKPGTVDGKPEPSWANLRYVWKIED